MSGDAELLPGEPLTRPTWLPTRAPVSLQDIALVSALREFRLELASALAIPWREGNGRGWLVAGVTPLVQSAGTLDPSSVRTLVSRLNRAHHEAALAADARLRVELSHAMRRLAVAQLDTGGVESLLKAIVVAARALLGTSAAYLSLPDEDDGLFRFTALLNIRTRAFRRLQMGPGAGLGGLARSEMRAVCSLNYAHDERLRSAPVKETLGEGIQSAMCSPLVASDGKPLGMLYVANRQLTPFSEPDVDLLDEFSSFAALSVERAELDRYRLEAMRRLEQERIAFELHDSLVRDLMQIGFTAEAGAVDTLDLALRDQFEVIGRTAELCLEKVREEITRMAAAEVSPDKPRPVGEVIEALRSTRSHGSVRRSFVVEEGSSRASLPANVATALIRIGQEALENCERHSGGTQAQVSLLLERDAIVLRVVDNGHGIAHAFVDAALGEGTNHLGLRRMRSAAHRLDGTLVLVPGERGGFVVQARIPLDEARP